MGNLKCYPCASSHARRHQIGQTKRSRETTFLQVWLKSEFLSSSLSKRSRMDSWQKLLGILEHRVNKQSYNTWFKPTQLIKHEGRALYVRVPNAFFQDWLNEHIDIVIAAAKDAGIGEIDV